MSIWRQIALTLVVALVATAIWARFYPGAGEQLARWGVDWLPFATAGSPPQETAGAQAPRRAPSSGVVTAPVVELTINDSLQAIGTGRAVRSVEVTPFASGRMVELLARSGTPVKRGDVIAKLDSEAEQIAAERAAIALKDTEARLERMQALRKSKTATLVQVTDAELAVGNARLELREAELALSRRSVESPHRRHRGHPADHGRKLRHLLHGDRHGGRPLRDPDRFLGAGALRLLRYRRRAVDGVLRGASGETFPGEVSAVDNRIDSASRTLQVQARIDNTADLLRAGMSFQVNMRFPGDRFRAGQPACGAMGHGWCLCLGGAGGTGPPRSGRHHPAQRQCRACRCATLRGRARRDRGPAPGAEGREVSVIGQEPGSTISRKPAPGASGS